MRKDELDGRRIKISPALEADGRFDRKKTGIHQIRDQQREGDCNAFDTNELPKEKHFDWTNMKMSTGKSKET